jgi:hypothetical protein
VGLKQAFSPRRLPNLRVFLYLNTGKDQKIESRTALIERQAKKIERLTALFESLEEKMERLSALIERRTEKIESLIA